MTYQASVVRSIRRIMKCMRLPEPMAERYMKEMFGIPASMDLYVFFGCKRPT